MCLFFTSLKRKIVFNAFLAILSVVVLSGCIQDPKVTGFSEVDFESLIDSTLQISFGTYISNENRIPVRLKDGRLSLLCMSDTVGHVEISEETKLSAKDTTLIPWNANFILPKIETVYPRVIKVDSAKIEVVGSTNYSVIGLPLSNQITKQMKVDLRALVAGAIGDNLGKSGGLTFKNFKMKRGQGADLMVNTEAVIENNLDIDYDIVHFDLGISTGPDKGQFAHWRMNSALAIKGNREIVLPVKIEINGDKLLANVNVFDLGSGKMDLHLTGEVEVSVNGFNYIIPVEFSKKVNMGSFF